MHAKVRVTGAVVLAAAASISGCAGPAHNTASSTNSSAPAASSAPDADIKQGVRDGEFAFTVSGMDAPQHSIGDQTAQGEFVVVHLHVTNIGNKGQHFFASNQKLIDANHKQYSDDSAAEDALPGNDQASDTTINPGNSIDAAVVFDVPVGTVPATLEVHDSAHSGGVTVKLS